jgi:hypothetical protein
LALPPATPTYAAALEFGELAGDAAHRAARRRHDDRFAGLGPAVLVEPDPRRDAGHADRAEVGRKRHVRRIDFAHAAAVAPAVELPARARLDEVADLEFLVARFDHFADRGADHDLADLGFPGIRLGVIHAPAHVGIERQVMRAHDEFAVRRGWHGRFHEAKVLKLDRPARTRGQ